MFEGVFDEMVYGDIGFDEGGVSGVIDGEDIGEGGDVDEVLGGMGMG